MSERKPLSETLASFESRIASLEAQIAAGLKGEKGEPGVSNIPGPRGEPGRDGRDADEKLVADLVEKRMNESLRLIEERLSALLRREVRDAVKTFIESLGNL